MNQRAHFRGGILLDGFDPCPAEILGRPATPMVRDFVGADRALKRLRVTPIDEGCLEHPPTVTPDAPVADARRAIEQTGAGWVAVVDAALTQTVGPPVWVAT